MPKFRTHDLIDTIGRVTGDTATLFVFDPETQDFVRKTTTILDDKGERILETPLAKDGPAYPVVSAGSTYSGEATILGVPYYTIYAPIQNLTNEVIGIVYVGIPKAEIDAAAVDGLKMLGLVGGIAVLVIGALSVFAASRLTRPIPRLSKAMGLVAAGELETAIPYTTHGNEIGDMARNVEVFRASALKVQELTEDERLALEQRRAERAEMMMTLQQSFGDVVEAATEGDFSRRVDAHFADDELNRLAHSVNRLVGTVEVIFADAGTALSAIADADLTQRMSGEYGGALGKLRDDTNNVTERLAHMVTTLKQTSGALKTATSEILSGANDLSERTTPPGGDHRRDHGRHAAARRHGARQCRKGRGCAPRRRNRVAHGRGGRGGDAAGQCRDGAHHAVVDQDLQHHRHDRRHRLPDQPARAERLG